MILAKRGPKTKQVRRASRAPAGAPDGRASPQIGVSTPKKNVSFINQLGRSSEKILLGKLESKGFSYTGHFSKRAFLSSIKIPESNIKLSEQSFFLSTEPGRGKEMSRRKSLSPRTFQKSNGPAVERNCWLPLESTCARNSECLLVFVSKRGP